MSIIKQKPAAGVKNIDALLEEGWHWNMSPMTYTFIGSEDVRDLVPRVDGRKDLTDTQKDAVRSAFHELANFTHVSFGEVDSPGTFNFVRALGFAPGTVDPETGDVSFGATQHLTGSTLGSAGPPAPPFLDQNTAGLVALSASNAGVDLPEIGTTGYHVVLHETGHALGLAHPDESKGLTGPKQTLDAEWSSPAYTVMLSGTNGTDVDHPQSYMLLDIQALQYLYGANFDLNARDHTTYKWTPTVDTTHLTNFFVNGRNPEPDLPMSGNVVFRTIWDAGGYDTYDFSAYTTNLRVSLVPGEWTDLGTQRPWLGSSTFEGNIANAYLYQGDERSMIEAAIGGSGHDTIRGNWLNNTLTGNGGNDVLNGGGGADKMYGGADNDTYVVDDLEDKVSEMEFRRIGGDFIFPFDAGGDDTVETYLQTYQLEENFFSVVENLAFTGFGTFQGTGNSADNRITGGFSTDTLRGLGGDDTLDGGGGADTMMGGADDDTYYVDDPGDVVDEEALGGSSSSSQVSSAFYRDAGSTSDTIVTSLASYDLSNTWSHNSPFFGGPSTRPPQAISGIVENLTMTGLSGINTGIGNDADNVIRGSLGVLFGPRYNFSGLGGKDTLIGGYGADHLDGGADADTMRGGDGDDTYVIDNAGDVVGEDFRGGSDTVQASISHTLHANVEDLVLTGTAAINGTGNRRPNELTGNTNNNILDGGLGADTMAGGLGNDTYVVDNAGDVVGEEFRGGSDTVQASISYTLHPNVEDLVLTGTAAINGTGNRRANELTGNSNNNILDGGAGNDTLFGFAGNDTFRFTTALDPSNVDKIVDFNVAEDTIHLDNAIFTGLAAGTLAAGAFRIGAAAADADDRIIYNNATGTLAYDADGNASGDATVFATIVPWTALTNSEFLVI